MVRACGDQGWLLGTLHAVPLCRAVRDLCGELCEDLCGELGGSCVCAWGLWLCWGLGGSCGGLGGGRAVWLPA